tara:strand:+ start:372 stop:875 length:504 start_codon:yes stop_codon:yes gene_type:complete
MINYTHYQYKRGIKMKKLLTLSLMMPLFAFANGWAVGYSNVDADEIKLGGLSGSYEWDLNESWSTELGLILGVSDDSASSDGILINAEIDTGYFAKVKYYVNDKLYLGLSVADYSIDATGSMDGLSMSVSMSEREQGIGIGYEVFNNFVVSFDALDEVDVLNFQYKF